MSKPAPTIQSLWFGQFKLTPREFRAPDTSEEVVRERLIAARRLNRLDQKDAAKRLGYKTSAPLSKIEGGQAKMPKGFLVKASLAYNVSADYLLGLSDEPERDPRTAEQRAIVRSVEASIGVHIETLIGILLRNAMELAPLENHLLVALNQSRAVCEAFDTVCMRNKQFREEVLAGSRLMSSVESLREAERAAQNYLDRRVEIKEERVRTYCEGKSLPLFGGDGEPADEDE